MCYGTKKEIKPVLENIIKKLISTAHVSTIKDDIVSIDYRMFSDILCIAMCGAERLKDKQSYEMLKESESKMGWSDEEEFILPTKDYKRIKNIYKQ